MRPRLAEEKQRLALQKRTADQEPFALTAADRIEASAMAYITQTQISFLLDHAFHLLFIDRLFEFEVELGQLLHAAVDELDLTVDAVAKLGDLAQNCRRERSERLVWSRA